MASELQHAESASGTPAGAASREQLAKGVEDRDPLTWYGLVWRIVRTALESDASLIRLCVLIVLVGSALWLIASVGK
jgi:hypothetical protein